MQIIRILFFDILFYLVLNEILNIILLHLLWYLFIRILIIFYEYTLSPHMYIICVNKRELRNRNFAKFLILLFLRSNLLQ